MKALMYRGPGEVSFENIPDAILPGEYGAVIKTSLCSICGSDLHPYHNDLGARDYCMGHEAVGEVVEVGSEVLNFKVGDRVLIPASIGCGRCLPCREGQVILCQSHPSFRAYGQGDPTIPGCQAEAVSITAADNNLFHIPESFSDELAIMLTDSLATAWFCARRGRIEPGNTVAVIGLGPIGLQAAMAAFAMGAAQVFGIELVNERREVAEKLGVQTFHENAQEMVMEATKGKGVDVVLEACGGEVTTNIAIDLVRRGGRISQLGVTVEPVVKFSLMNAFFKNVEFYTGVCSVQAEVPHLIDALLSKKLDSRIIEDTITHRMNLS
ncbi:MAG: alcohol dehydrogenase catalytic domain-containing protein, partial [Anaerovoracaceae bacterium]